MWLQLSYCDGVSMGLHDPPHMALLPLVALFSPKHSEVMLRAWQLAESSVVSWRALVVEVCPVVLCAVGLSKHCFAYLPTHPCCGAMLAFWSCSFVCTHTLNTHKMYLYIYSL